ncbi:MAG: glycosyltransferase family 2 protein, partial [Acidobacteriota bacterium]
MLRFLTISNITLFVYYLLSNIVYLALLITAIIKNTAHRARLASLRLEHLRISPFTPPVTLLVPAHNEEQFIVESVRSLLAIDYPDLEVIVINDGSVDSTLEQLKHAYGLKAAKLLYIQEVPSAKIHAIYRSELQPHLIVVDKEAGGSKADAVNAGLNAATSPYVCIVDADSILERDSLLRIMAGVLNDPARVMAVGGIVRVLNGSRVVAGELKEV